MSVNELYLLKTNYPEIYEWVEETAKFKGWSLHKTYFKYKEYLQLWEMDENKKPVFFKNEKGIEFLKITKEEFKQNIGNPLYIHVYNKEINTDIYLKRI